MSEGFQTFSFGEGDGHIGNKQKPWKAEAGRSYRLSFAWFPISDGGMLEMGQADSGLAPKFFGGPTNFIPGAGCVMNQGPEWTKLAGEPPRTRIATVMVIWPVDSKGTLDKARIQAGDFEVVPWVISGDKYRNLEQLHREFPFNEHDITVNCTDTQFQKLTFSPCKDNLLRSIVLEPKAAALAKKVAEQVGTLTASVQGFIGRSLTIAQIQEKMSGGPGGAPIDAAETVASGNIDGLVDNILDS